MRPIFLPLLVLTLLGAVPATADVGASLGLLSGDADDGKNELRRPFRFEAPALTFELAGGKDEGRSPRASADAKILRVTWAGSGTFESYQADHGWRTDDEPDLTYVQVRLTSGMGAWHGLGGIAPLSLALDFEGQGGYLNILDGADGFDAKVEEAWLLFPFSATLLLDGPLGLSPWASAGYDPVTGVVSLLYKNVHQSWCWGFGLDWQVLPWLAAEAGLREQTTNISDETVLAFRTRAATFGLRLDLDRAPW